MAKWCKFKGFSILSDAIIQIRLIPSLFEAIQKGLGEVPEADGAVWAPRWSHFEGFPVFGDGIIQIRTISSLFEASQKGRGEVI